jgi:hypothetical protein
VFKQRFINIFLLVASMIFCNLPTAQNNNSSGPHDQVGAKIADAAFQIITSLKSTKYKDFPYTINIQDGVYETDEAGFITHLLKKTAPDHLALVPFEEGKFYHSVADYYNYFLSIKNSGNRLDSAFWKIIFKISESKRGDIIAWADDSKNIFNSNSHLLVVGDDPKPVSDNVYEVIVYDATNKLYNRDIRTPVGGVGYGYLRFQTDSSSVATDYQYKVDDVFHKSNIIIARPR